MTPLAMRKEYRVARSKVQHGFLLAAVLGAIGVGIMIFGPGAIPDATLVGAVNLVVAVGVLAAVLRSSRDSRPHLVLSDEGVWYEDWGIGALPWIAVRDAAIIGVRLNPFLSVRLRNAEEFLAGLTETERAKLENNRLVRLPELRIPSGALDAPLEEILAEIQAGLRASGDQQASQR